MLPFFLQFGENDDTSCTVITCYHELFMLLSFLYESFILYIFFILAAPHGGNRGLIMLSVVYNYIIPIQLLFIIICIICIFTVGEDGHYSGHNLRRLLAPNSLHPVNRRSPSSNLDLQIYTTYLDCLPLACHV